MDWVIFAGKLVSLFLVLWYWPVNLMKLARGHAVSKWNFIMAAAAAVAFLAFSGWLS